MVRLRRAVAVLVVLVLVLSFATAAGAGKRKHPKGQVWKSEITLVHATPTQFSGTVSSKLGACRSQRLVTVFYTDPQTGQTQPVSVQRATKDGHYVVNLTMAAYAGVYQAQVSKQRIRAHKAPQTCKGAVSSTLTV